MNRHVKHLWTYGCSFTAGYEKLRHTNKTWQYYLDLGSPIEIINKADVAKPLNHAREELMGDLGSIQREDLVIFQLTFSNRVFVPYFKEEYDLYFKVRDWHVPKGDMVWFPYMKEGRELDEALMKEAYVIFTMLQNLNIRFMWWTAGELDEDLVDPFKANMLTFGNHQSYYKWINHNLNLWYQKGDPHQNEDGHKLMADIFSKQIRKYLGIQEIMNGKLL